MQRSLSRVRFSSRTARTYRDFPSVLEIVRAILDVAKKNSDGERKIVQPLFAKVEDCEYVVRVGGWGVSRLELDEINSDRLFLNYRAAPRTRATATGDGLKFHHHPL